MPCDAMPVDGFGNWTNNRLSGGFMREKAYDPRNCLVTHPQKSSCTKSTRLR